MYRNLKCIGEKCLIEGHEREAGRNYSGRIAPRLENAAKLPYNGGISVPSLLSPDQLASFLSVLACGRVESVILVKLLSYA